MTKNDQNRDIFTNSDNKLHHIQLVLFSDPGLS